MVLATIARVVTTDARLEMASGHVVSWLHATRHVCHVGSYLLKIEHPTELPVILLTLL
jgi:hypothetical protein